MARQVNAKVMPIEKVYRRQSWLELKFFIWYFFAYSTAVFWSEVVVVLLGVLFLFAGGRLSPGFMLLVILVVNVHFSFLLTVGNLKHHSRERAADSKWFALRFHPLMFIGYQVPRVLVCGMTQLFRWASYPLVSEDEARPDDNECA